MSPRGIENIDLLLATAEALEATRPADALEIRAWVARMAGTLPVPRSTRTAPALDGPWDEGTA
jgi:hypothetical protein